MLTMFDTMAKLCQAQWAENLRLTNKAMAGMNRLSQFSPGVPTQDGAPRQKIYEDGQMVLYRYDAPTPATAVRVPLLIVYALVNKPYMLDLAPDKSFVRGLLQQGLDVYLTEWKDPSCLAVKPTLSDYILGSVKNGVKAVSHQHQDRPINLMGICQGGTLSLIYTALHPETVKNLLTVVTPLDFHAGDNIFTHLSQYCDTQKISELLPTLSGDFLNIGFLQLKPFELLLAKYLGMLEIWDDPDKLDFFMRMEKWIYDGQSLSGPAWHTFISDCYQQNKLVAGQMELAGQKIALTRITCPVLNVTADKDHLVPPPCSEGIGRATSSSDYTHLRFPVGHIGMFVSDQMQTKIVPAISAWLNKRGNCNEQSKQSI